MMYRLNVVTRTYIPHSYYLGHARSSVRLPGHATISFRAGKIGSAEE